MSEGKTVLRRQITIANRILNFVKNTKEKKSQKIQTELYFEGRLGLLEQYWKEFCSRHNELIEYEELLAEDDYFKLDCYSTVEDEFLSAKAELTADLRCLKAFESSSTTSSNQVPVPQAARVDACISATPSLSVPKFAGKQREWETFRGLFCSIIKDNPRLTPVVKLQYLINSLEGPAAQRLKGINIVDANLEVAWEKLLRRYDNPRIRLANHLDRIIYAKSIKHKSPGEINRLIDIAEEAIQGLRDLECPVNQWDQWFVHLISQKLDYETREAWEITQENIVGSSSYKNLSLFLEKRVRSLEQAHFEEKFERPSSNNPKQGNPIKSRQIHANVAQSNTTYRRKQCCIMCKGNHSLSFCSKFGEMTVGERKEQVKRNKLCSYCLRNNHLISDCYITSRCLICNGKHHTKLHMDNSLNTCVLDSTSDDSQAVTSAPTVQRSQSATVLTSLAGKAVLLATAQVVLKSTNGLATTVRALLDPAAERSFISESVANLLSLKRKTVNVSVTGVGGNVTSISHGYTNLILCSNVNTDFTMNFSALILNKLTSVLPSKEVIQTTWPHIDGLQLADPFFSKPLRVDCILGADVYAAVLRGGVRRGPHPTPVAQETALGWILTGQTSGDSSHCQAAAFQTTLQPDTSEMLNKLWELEEVPSQPRRSPDDDCCEELFRETVHRNTDGRYVVKLPLFNTPHFPDSRHIAVSAFLKAEKRRSSKPDLNTDYIHFMEEYERLGHMAVVPQEDIEKQPTYYMPHHVVYRSDVSKKVRVVFNASQRSTSGFSLNDFLKSGPKLQLDLAVILTRWRFYRFVFVADIVKMFRQILVQKDDAEWQRIVWRSDPSQPIRDFKLLTVTYGTASAPYLAIRTLLQLADDEEERFPEGSAILRDHIYVDDMFSGGDTIENAEMKQAQLIQMLGTAGFSLGKWSANQFRLLAGIQSGSSEEKTIINSETVPTLGLKWSPESDCFSFKITCQSSTSTATKRTILSQIAKLFYPLGWLSPVLIRAKILLQDLWISGVDWDSPITGKLADDWSSLKKQLLVLKELQIPRWFGAYTTDKWQLHGFADASERAYAAAVYYRSKKGISRLIFAKAKVAPIKTISLPRLELCGSLLLARVIEYVLSLVLFKPEMIHCWTDSKVVLCWLTGHPSNWKSFVANRVSEILDKCPNAQWHHVKSADNPADCATRGYTAEKLRDSLLWWNGPSWISLDCKEWPCTDLVPSTTVHEQKSKVLVGILGADEHFIRHFKRYSSFSKIIRILAYCVRWFHYRSLPANERNLKWLTTVELSKARTLLWRHVQQEYFNTDINCIRKGKTLPRGSALSRLTPFLCEKGLLRVGGRLQYSSLPFEEKHPIILPKDNTFTRLLVEEAHRCTLHGGPQLMLSYLSRFCWILRGRRVIQSVFKNCVKCARFSGKSLTQQMSPLPAERLTPQRAFSYTGLDYAGPLWLRNSKGRGTKSHKGYIAIFICMVSRAIHLEVVTDLTSESFLAAYHRFTARRGLCTALYSDNASTFRAASQELKRLFSRTSSLSTEIAERIAKEGTTWSFIPPRAPHFGGLWEAAVRSFKYHLKRVLGDAILTYEELLTLVLQIEACLNSRPLTAVDSQLKDFTILTPGHFLFGSPLLSPPTPFLEADLQQTHTSRWKQITCMRNAFWKTWRKDVLHQLQQRNQWLNPSNAVHEGDIVILRDEISPPTRWPIGKIIALHPGRDGLNRVATVKTASTVLKRPLIKLILLPVDKNVVSHYASIL